MEGYIHRTPRGREATEKAFKHLGVTDSKLRGTLFDLEIE
jgi:Holliday junction DNA helicase RuvB